MRYGFTKCDFARRVNGDVRMDGCLFCGIGHLLSFDISELLSFLEAFTTPYFHLCHSAEFHLFLLELYASGRWEVVPSGVDAYVCLDVLRIIVGLVPQIILKVAR
jgi:hypothetical protein